MNTIIEHLMGMNTMTDQVIAMDMLVTAKSGVRNYAMAITEVGAGHPKHSNRIEARQYRRLANRTPLVVL